MANHFNKNLSEFLTVCKQSALEDLKKSNSDYRQLRSHATEIAVRVKNEIPSEHENLIEELSNSVLLLADMEINYLYLQGFKDCINLYKRFNGSFAESQDLEKLFL
jgi:hypothetical protein